tara:strand:- start:36 stop:479 length:444 start_codon:yes stop_codon:yes gene_type:complete
MPRIPEEVSTGQAVPKGMPMVHARLFKFLQRDVPLLKIFLSKLKQPLAVLKGMFCESIFPDGDVQSKNATLKFVSHKKALGNDIFIGGAKQDLPDLLVCLKSPPMKKWLPKGNTIEESLGKFIPLGFIPLFPLPMVLGEAVQGRQST